MEKPNGYDEFYKNAKINHISRSQWPIEYLKYVRWSQIIRRHPEWKDLSDDELALKIKENRQLAHEKAQAAIKAKLELMSEEERKAFNKRKGSYYNNMTSEEKLKHNEILRSRSNKFWNNMDNKQRKEFVQYRESCLSEEQKANRTKRFLDANKEYIKNLSPEQIMDQINHMNQIRKEKYDNDPEFRMKNHRQLRDANIKYFANMSDEERKEFYKKNGERVSQVNRNRWINDTEYRKQQTEFLRAHARDYIDSLSPEELKIHTEKLFDNLHKFLDSKSSSELNQLMHDNKFNTKFEKQFNDSIISNDFYYVKEYKVTKSLHDFKIWDYAIYNKSNNKLVMVVDLDGEFYHGDSCDYNGLHGKEERDEKRGEFIPEEVKVYIISQKNFIEEFEDMIKMLMENYDEYIDELFKLYRSIKFPYPSYSQMELIDSFRQLERLDVNNKYLSISTRNREGDRLIQHFHPSIYRAHRKNSISPRNAWDNDELLYKVIQNRVLYRSILDANKILQGFNISKIAQKVSVFSAGRAKLIISKYLSNYDTIFDPFSGFSGRMLGTISLNKQYIGQDISKTHVNESLKMIEFLNRSKINYKSFISPLISCKNILDSYGEYPCLFTCPPYSDKEQWEDVPVDMRTCDDWIDICLSHFKCNRYVFVVDTTEKYKDYIVDEIINKSHMNTNKEYVIVIDKTEGS